MEPNETDANGASILAAPPADVETKLLAYLAGRLDASGLTFAETPEQITHGWETFIYTFRLAGDGLTKSWRSGRLSAAAGRS